MNAGVGVTNAGARVTNAGAGMMRARWMTGAVFGLVVMITWTVVVKYLAPLVWAWSETAAGRAPAAAPVMWDFWPLLHVVLAGLLWRSRARLGPRVWGFALSVAVVESAIVMVKLAAWWGSQDAGFWKLLWLTNKVYVLLFFIWLGARLLAARPSRHGEPAVVSSEVNAALAPRL